MSSENRAVIMIILIVIITIINCAMAQYGRDLPIYMNGRREESLQAAVGSSTRIMIYAAERGVCRIS